MPGALTRIRNNQVYNSDIHAATKIVPGSITGALWNSALTYTGNLTVANLTINGQTTALDTTNVISSDPIIVLNRNFSGANTYDVGLLLGRGNQTNTAIVWNESNKEFAFIYTSTTTNGSYYGTLPNSGYANIHAYGGAFNNITVTTSSVTNFSAGNVRITGGYIDGTAIGANTPNTVVATSVTTTSGGQLTGYLTGPIGANTANTGVFTSVNTVSGGQITGYLTGAIGANTPNSAVFTTITATGNVGFGSVFANGAAGSQFIGYHTGVIGANVPNSGAFTTLTATSTATFSGQANLNTLTAVTMAAGTIGNAGALILGTNALITGNVGFGSVFANGAAGSQFIGYLTGAIGANVANTGVFTSVATVSGGQISGYITGAIGANTANSGAFTTLTASGTTTLSGQANLNTMTAATIAAGTIGNSGALVQGSTALFTGNVGFGSVFANGAAGSQFIGYLTGAIGANVANTGVFTSVATVSGGQLTGYVTGPIGANTANTGVFTSVNTVSGGQITGYLTGAIGANTANTGAFTTLTASGITTITNTTDATANATGALQVSGGASISKNLWVQGDTVMVGNLTVQGAQTIIGSANQYLLDPILNMHTFANLAALTTNDGYDIGLKLHYYDGADNHAFVGRQNTTGSLVYYSAATEVGNVITGGTFGTIKGGALQASNTTVSTSTATGALQVSGGAGILGNLYVGGGINGIIGNASPASGAFTTVNTVSGGQITGYLTGAIGANTPNTGVFTSVTTSGGGQLTGYLTGALGANTPNTVVATSVTTVSGGQLTGYVTGPIGANTANTGVFTSVTTVSGGQVTGYMTGPIGANTANTGVFTSVTTVSGGQLTGYVTGPIGANTANTGVFTSVTTVSGGQLTGYMTGPIGANTANSGAFTTLSASSTTTLSGQANLNTMTAATIAAATIGNSGALIQGATATFTGNVGTGSVFANGAAGSQFIGYHTGAIGANVANTGAFTTLTTTSTLIASGNVVASSGTASTNTTTGALVVVGGEGVSGALNVGGGVNLQGNGVITTDQTTATVFNTVATTVNFAGAATTINIGAATGNTTVNNGFLADDNVWLNSGGTASNLVVQGNTTAGYSNLLVTNGATGQVGIKRAPGNIKAYTSLDINATDTLLLPAGTTGQRPPSGQEQKGMIRFNTTNNQLENWDGTQWSTGGATFTIISADAFTGDGTTVAFTLSQSATTNSALVMINGVVQIPATAYTVSGTTLTFTEAPLSTDIIDARVITTTVTVSSLVDGTTSLNTSNALPAIYATVQNSNVWIANTSTYFNGGISAFNANTSLTQNTLTTVDTFVKTKFRSAKYVITVSDFAGAKYQTAEVLVVHDGTTATATQYGVVSTSGSSFVTYGASVSGSNVILQANSTSAASYASVQQIYNPV